VEVANINEMAILPEAVNKTFQLASEAVSIAYLRYHTKYQKNYAISMLRTRYITLWPTFLRCHVLSYFVTDSQPVSSSRHWAPLRLMTRL